MNIILCDDDKFILKLASDRINGTIHKYRLDDVQITCMATDSMEVFQYVKNNPGEHLVFLDLDFGSGKLNGVDVARQIKMMCNKTKIVFVTNHKDMAMNVLASGVEPFGFLEKTSDMQKLSNGYFRYIQMALSTFHSAKKKEDKLELVVGIDETVSIQKSQILYVESVKTISHGITYHTLNGSCITVRDTMEHVLQLLGNDFIRVHRSVIANRKYMISLSGTNIHMSNGEEIPCAVRMRTEVRKCMQ